MQNVILVIHIIASVVMTIVIMLQKSEGGALGIGGGGGGLMTGRSAAGALVRVTMIFGGIFFMTSLGLTSIANRTTDDRSAVERALEEENPDAVTGVTDIFDPNAPLLGTPSSDEDEDDDAIAPPLDDAIAPALPDEETTEPESDPQ